MVLLKTIMRKSTITSAARGGRCTRSRSSRRPAPVVEVVGDAIEEAMSPPRNGVSIILAPIAVRWARWASLHQRRIPAAYNAHRQGV